MQMPKVSKCDVAECFYNAKNICHAPAINVGRDHPACDTYIKDSRHGGAIDMTGSVGACKIGHCRYNKDLICSAQSINVGHHENHADCKTYTAR